MVRRSVDNLGVAFTLLAVLSDNCALPRGLWRWSLEGSSGGGWILCQCTCGELLIPLLGPRRESVDSLLSGCLEFLDAILEGELNFTDSVVGESFDLITSGLRGALDLMDPVARRAVDLIDAVCRLVRQRRDTILGLVIQRFDHRLLLDFECTFVLLAGRFQFLHTQVESGLDLAINLGGQLTADCFRNGLDRLRQCLRIHSIGGSRTRIRLGVETVGENLRTDK